MKGRKVADTVTRIPIKDTELELRIAPITTKELVAFDFGMLFKKGTNEVQIYVDDDLRASIDGLLEIHGQIILKVNAFSPDVMIIAPNE